MADSNATLASLWVDDGQGSPLKMAAPASQTKATGRKIPEAVRDDIVKYFSNNGLDYLAKEAGIIDADGDLKGFKAASTSKTQAPRYVAVAIPHTPSKTSSTNTDQPQLLPKDTPIQVLTSPSPRHATVHSDSSPWSAQKRGADVDFDFLDGKRSKRGARISKGLRHFSMKVCEKVQQKGVTTYNEVADELVAEFTDRQRMAQHDQSLQGYDQKNIRRRVYDALNVLMAMNIISKEKKEIKWIGLPTNSAQEVDNLEVERQRRLERIKCKQQQLQELILQQIAFKNLVQRNHEREQAHGPPAPNSTIKLPYIIVNTSKRTTIDCNISSDKHEYLFKFNDTFEIHDDIEVLKRMGLALGLEKGECSAENLARATRMVPKALESYVNDMAQGNTTVSLGSGGIRPIEPTALVAQQLQRGQSQTAMAGSSSQASCHLSSSQDLDMLSYLSSHSSNHNSRSTVGSPSNFSDDDDSDFSPADLLEMG